MYIIRVAAPVFVWTCKVLLDLLVQPRRSDLDMNQHVNNVKYINWMMEVQNDSDFFLLLLLRLLCTYMYVMLSLARYPANNSWSTRGLFVTDCLLMFKEFFWFIYGSEEMIVSSWSRTLNCFWTLCTERAGITGRDTWSQQYNNAIQTWMWSIRCSAVSHQSCRWARAARGTTTLWRSSKSNSGFRSQQLQLWSQQQQQQQQQFCHNWQPMFWSNWRWRWVWVAILKCWEDITDCIQQQSKLVELWAFPFCTFASHPTRCCWNCSRKDNLETQEKFPYPS